MGVRHLVQIVTLHFPLRKFDLFLCLTRTAFTALIQVWKLFLNEKKIIDSPEKLIADST